MNFASLCCDAHKHNSYSVWYNSAHAQNTYLKPRHRAMHFRTGSAAAAAACATMEKYMLGQTKAIVYISSTVRARGIFASIRNAMRWQRQNHCVLKDNGAMRRAQNAIKFSIYVFCRRRRRRTASADIMCVYVPRTYTAKKSSSIHNFIKPNNQKTCEPINRSEKKRRTCAARVH